MNINNFLNSNFVFCINLDKRKERWDIAQKNIKDIGFENIQKFSAIDGSLFKKDSSIKDLLSVRAYHDLETVKETHQGIYSKGAIGCYLSHALLWKKLLNSNEEYMIIFEDDIVFPKKEKFHKKLNEVLENINLNDIDFLFLGYGKFVDSPINLNKILYKIKGLFFGLQFYVITKNGARKALEKAFPIEMQIDNYLSYLGESGDLKLLASKENLGYQSTYFFNSDIQEICIKCYLSPNKSFYIIIVLIIIILILLFYKNKKELCNLIN